MRKQGFVTIEHSFAQLSEMHHVVPHTLALVEDSVVGYALSMHPRFTDSVEALKPMFVEIRKAIGEHDEFIVMGQICIAKAHRGQGVFRGLYHHMRAFMPPQFSKIITEVDTKNIRSMNAHKAIGFTEMHRYTAGEKEWSLIVL